MTASDETFVLSAKLARRPELNLSRVLTGAHADTTQMSCSLHTPSRRPTTTARCSGRWRCGPSFTRRTAASTARRPVPCGR
eukprot:3747880-Prymnesium_polylepis.1